MITAEPIIQIVIQKLSASIYENSKEEKNSAILRIIPFEIMAIKAVPPAKNPMKGIMPRKTVIKPRIREIWTKGPAIRFEKTETTETSPKAIAETGSTERLAVSVTEKASATAFKYLFSVLSFLQMKFLSGDAKTEIAPQEITDIRKPMSQQAIGQIKRTIITASPRFSLDFDPRKKIPEA